MTREATRALREDDAKRRDRLAAALTSEGSVLGASRLLGISAATTWRWIKEFGITPPRPRRLV
jgi:transcriptional regulator of acetoin/glycerol metabolism